MLKRGVLLVLVLLVIPIVFAAIPVTYNFSEEDVSLDIYSCGTSCNRVELVDSLDVDGSSVSYEYEEEGTYLLTAYKYCFFPLVNSMPVDPVIEDMEIDLDLGRKNGCSASVGDSILVNGDYLVNSDLEIVAGVTSPFLSDDFIFSGFLNDLSSDREVFFETLVRVRLYVDDNLVDEKNESFFVDDEKQISFDWRAEESGSYVIKIVSDVVDCKCLNPQRYNREITIEIEGETVDGLVEEVVNDSEDSVETINFSLVSAEGVEIIGVGCGEGDGCNVNCLEGDKDCTCDIQEGNVCSDDQSCEGRLLKNWGDNLCCSGSCVNNSGTHVVNFASVRDAVSLESNQSANETSGSVLPHRKNNSIYFVILVFALVVLVSLLFGVEKTRNGIFNFVKRVFVFLKEKLVKGFEFIKKEEFILKEKLKKKKEIKPAKKKTVITPLLENIMESLKEEENKVIMRIIEREGIKKKDLEELLGYDHEKLDFCLLKLNRRQIIKMDNGENPEIYINDWLK